MKRVGCYLLLAATFLVASCATTEVTSLNNPKYANRSLGKVAVIASIQDIKMRRAFESPFVAKLKEAGMEAAAGMDVLPPLRDYSDTEIKKALSENQIDTVFLLTLTAAYTEETQIAAPSSTTESSGTVYGNTYSENSNTTYSKGQYISQPRMKFEVKVVVVENEDVMWRAQTLTAGGSSAEVDTMAQSLASEVVKKFLAR